MFYIFDIPKNLYTCKINFDTPKIYFEDPELIIRSACQPERLCKVGQHF